MVMNGHWDKDIAGSQSGIETDSYFGLHFKGTILIVHIKYNVNCYFKNDERG